MDPRSQGADDGRPRLPRTRGDGPRSASTSASTTSASPHTRGWTSLARTARPYAASRASPHTRGWTPGRAHDVGPRRGFPAHAGMDRDRGADRRDRARLPRTRGDGPSRPRCIHSVSRASPHTRGWTRLVVNRMVDAGGFPAHAGMDPGGSRASHGPPGLPRTRGDGPDRYRLMPCPSVASPHTRGWTRCRQEQRARRHGFPAHAGMDPGGHRATRGHHGLPRTRGDGPSVRRRAMASTPASPHTRGWTRGDHPRAEDRVGFPAHAGMDPGRRQPDGVRKWLPRTRGDGPWSGRSRVRHRAASPHTRGWTRAPHRARRPRSGFPAHAGMDPTAARPLCTTRRLPRTRGDGPRLRHVQTAQAAASPHTRGWTVYIALHVNRKVGFPAHAGMDPRRSTRSSGRSGLPRTRGDGPASEAQVHREAAASPHTRGWTPLDLGAGTLRSGFPAHAGMDRWPPRRATRTPGLPRTRGDGPPPCMRTVTTVGASPHTRGWTVGRQDQLPNAAGFPAHAGMDPTSGTRLRSWWGLPRTRGDGPLSAMVGAARTKASPHTRGWTRRRAGGPHRRDGFPAHAGMDPVPESGDTVIVRLPRTRGDGPVVVTDCTSLTVASPHTRGWTRHR